MKVFSICFSPFLKIILKDYKTAGLCPTPRKLFEKSLIKNFNGMRVAHSGGLYGF